MYNTHKPRAIIYKIFVHIFITASAPYFRFHARLHLKFSRKIGHGQKKNRGIAADPLEWWVAMNMIYSDYCVVAEKLGTSTAEFYAGMARAFLDHKDAQPDKLGRYYEYIVRH